MNDNSIPTANTYDGKRWVLADDYIALFEKCHAEKKQAAVPTGRLRDTFAAAALTGILANEGDGLSLSGTCQWAYRIAAAMLRERANHSEKPNGSANHDAAPAARGRTMTHDNEEPSAASAGYATNGGDMNLIYIGDHFYSESGTMMSPIYTEDGRRSDWGFVQCALRDGGTVNIRQATQAERDHYEAQLSRLKRKFAAERRRR